MTKEEIIKEAAKKYATHPTDTDNTDFYGNYEKEMRYNHDEYLAFIEGARLSDSISPWISVKEDLPCNHEELLCYNKRGTVEVLVRDKYGNVYTNVMRKGADAIWFFAREQRRIVEFWMRIPEPPKE